MGRVIITRIREGINQLLKDEQARYKSGRSTAEQIFVLQNIIEQVIEWNACLYVYFLDFEKAFDSVHRETLWCLKSRFKDQSFEVLPWKTGSTNDQREKEVDVESFVYLGAKA